MALVPNPESFIEDFISTQVTSRGLDERTARAYRFDLRLLFRWMESVERAKENPDKSSPDKGNLDKGNPHKEKTDKGCQQIRMREDQNSQTTPGALPDLPPYIWEDRIEAYLEHLVLERGRRSSTICRKHLVFGPVFSAAHPGPGGDAPLQEVPAYPQLQTVQEGDDRRIRHAGNYPGGVPGPVRLRGDLIWDAPREAVRTASAPDPWSGWRWTGTLSARAGWP